MAPAVVETHKLSKRYSLGERTDAYLTLRDTLASIALRRRASQSPQDVWALRDVDLAVEGGEVLGIVGRNGAGKTTLLKILTRITRPTAGLARTRGRVGALLEVGTGFHPELTGRENVFLNGAILGMSKREIAARFDTIVDFAGVGRFIDTPLKRYSSGMQLRLAFAVAAHLEPDIIVVDEVLAVGDVEFQRRCLGKMSELTGGGRTVLFVSHDLGALGKLCSRAIWIEAGRIVADGPTKEVLKRYVSATGEPSTRLDLAGKQSGPIRLLSVEVHGEGDGARRAPVRDESLYARVRFAIVDAVAGLDIAIIVTADNGTIVLDEAWSDTGEPMVAAGDQAQYEVTLRIPPVLAAGVYRLGLWLGTAYEDFVGDYVPLTFEVGPRHDDNADSRSRIRTVQPAVEWGLERAPLDPELLEQTQQA